MYSACSPHAHAHALCLLHACRTFSLALNVLLHTCADQFENSRYLVCTGKVVPLTDLSVLVLGRALSSRQQQLGGGGGSRDEAMPPCPSTTLCGPLLRLLASTVSTLAQAPTGQDQAQLSLQVTDTIRYTQAPYNEWLRDVATGGHWS